MLLPLYLPLFLIQLGYGMILPVTPLLARRLGADLALTGLVVAAYGIGNLLFDLPAGALLGRFDRRRLMLVAAASALLVALATGFARSVLLLAVLQAAMGAVHSLWMISVQLHLREVAVQRQRGRALSLAGGVTRVGVFLGPLIGGIAGKSLGLQSSFFVQAGVNGLALAALTVWGGALASSPAVLPERPTARRGGGVRLLRGRRVLPVAVVIVMLQLIRAGRRTLIPVWGDQIGLDVQAVGLVLSLSWGMDMALFYPAGLIMDRRGRKWAAVPCLLILSLSLALIPLTRGFTGLVLVGLLAGAGNGLGSGIVMTLGTDLAPRAAVGPFLGLWRLISDVGTAVGPLMIGAVSQLVSLGAAPLPVAALGLAGAAIMAARVREPLGTAGREPAPPRPPPAPPG